MHVYNKIPSFPQHQAIATLSQAAAVQNTWYTVLDTTLNVEILAMCVTMATLAEDLAFRLTIDGEVITGSQAAAVADQPYWIHLQTTSTSVILVANAGWYLPLKYATLKGSSVKFEVRKTSANGANTLKGSVLYNVGGA